MFLTKIHFFNYILQDSVFIDWIDVVVVWPEDAAFYVIRHHGTIDVCALSPGVFIFHV